MKSIAVAVFSFAVFTAVWSIDPSALKKAMADVRTCIKKNPEWSPEVGYKFMMLDFSEPKDDFKCLFKCLAQTYGGIDQEGNLHKENMIQLVANFAPELESQALEIWETCAEKVPKVGDLCEYAFQLSKCGFEQCESSS